MYIHMKEVYTTHLQYLQLERQFRPGLCCQIETLPSHKDQTGRSVTPPHWHQTILYEIHALHAKTKGDICRYYNKRSLTNTLGNSAPNTII